MGKRLTNFFKISDGERRNGKYIVVLLAALTAVWLGYDYTLPHRDSKQELLTAVRYSFEGKTAREVEKSLETETQRLIAGKDETEQILGFVNILERYSYLLYLGEIGLDNFYDAIGPFILPSRKERLKNKSDYVLEANRYLGRLRSTGYQYYGYTAGVPAFRFTEYSRMARVELIRETSGGKERHHYTFRRSRDRYYLDFE